MKLYFMVILIVTSIASAADYGDIPLGRGKDIIFKPGAPGNAEMWLGNVHNATHVNTIYLHASNEYFGYDKVVFQLSTTSYVADHTGEILTTGTVGTDDVTVLDYAQDNAAGPVYVGPGTWTWLAGETLLLKQNTYGAGIGATIFKLADGLINDSRTIIECSSNVDTGFYEIDGNSKNNIYYSWANVDDTPFAQGIYTSRRLSNGQVYAASENVSVHDIYIHDTIRSSVVLTGSNCKVYNMILDNCTCDHHLYISRGFNCTARDLYITGGCSGESIVFGTSAATRTSDCVVSGVRMNGVYGSDYFPTAAYCRLISLRDGAGERNTIRDVQIDTYDSYQTYQVIRGSQPDIIIDHVNAEIATCNSNKVVLFTNGSSISDNLNVRVIDSTATATSYLLYLYHGNRTDAAIDYVFTDSSFVEQDADNIYYRGIGIIPTTDVVSAAFDNVVVDVESNAAVRIAGDTKTVTVYNDGWRFVDDVSDVSASGTIKYPRNSGSTSGTGSQQTIAHGLFATPSRIYITPTATGADAFVSAAADATNVYVTAGSGKGYKWYAEV